MSQDDFNARVNEIQAILDDETKSPNMPVDIFLQEAENCYQWCQVDKDLLTNAGLDWSLVEDLPARTGALREAQSLWTKERFTKEEAEKEWKLKSPDAYDLRNSLLHDFRFAFRKESDLLNRVSAITDGNGHADMIQDLNDLALLGKDNTELLEKINFDVTLLDKAAALAGEMADLLSKATYDRSKDNEEKVLRDKAYTFLKQAVDEIRTCGQYVFWRNEDRLKGYVSQYFKKRNKNASSEETTVTV